jgi:hypothetical protein
MKTASASTLTDVAQYIAPNDAPIWLPDLLRVWGDRLANDRELQEKLPSKAHLKKRLLEAKNAAKLIIDVINDPMTMIFIDPESNISIKNIVQFEIDLNVFADAAEHAAAGPMISEAKGGIKKGRGRAMLSTTLSAKAFCALIVAEIWLAVRRRRPALRNREASAAAQALWLACGGTSKGWGSDPRTGWSYHFREARSASTRLLRAEVRQHATELRAQYSRRLPNSVKNN